MSDHYVNALGQSYRYSPDSGRLKFDDGTVYDLFEAFALSKGACTDEDLFGIHLVKKIFDGEIDGLTVVKKRMAMSLDRRRNPFRTTPVEDTPSAINGQAAPAVCSDGA